VAKFSSKRQVVTRAVADWMEKNEMVAACIPLMLTRHFDGDWGSLDREDKKANDAGLVEGSEDRVMSSFKIDETDVWIITEWDRSVTTVLFPEDY